MKCNCGKKAIFKHGEEIKKANRSGWAKIIKKYNKAIQS